VVHKSRTRPVPGNYYACRLGSWHIIALNSEISAFPGSPRLEWLRGDEVRNNSTWGVLKLTLRADAHDWEFVPVAGQTFTDQVTGTCH
jgi:hypothetical protein